MERLDFELKAFTDAGEIEGIASPIGGSPDRVGDIVAPGAFAHSLAEHRERGTMPAMLVNHDPKATVGSWDGIEETPEGLRVRGKLATGTEKGEETYQLVSAKALQCLSIGYRTVKATRMPGGYRRLDEVDLVEISIVSTPAAPNAVITSVKSVNPKESIMTDSTAATGDTTDLTTRVSALETTVADINDRLGKVEETGNKAAKSLDRIEVKMNRPAATVKTDEAGDIEVKALAAFAKTGSDIEIKAASTVSDPAGGYLELPQLDTTIRKVARDVSPLRKLANVVSTTSDTYEIVLDPSEAEAAWIGETDAPTLTEVSIPVHEFYAAPRATQKLIDDSPANVAAWLTGSVADRLARLEGAAFTSGDGVGKPQGFLSLPTDPAADFTRPWGKLQTVKSGSASGITPDALITLSMALRTPYRTSNAAFLMNRNTATVVRQMTDKNGRYLWGDEGVNEQTPGTLLGFKVVLDETMPEIAAGTTPIAFGDWKSGYTIVDRHGVRLIRDNLTAKPYTIFYSYARVGGAVTDTNAIKLLSIAA